MATLIQIKKKVNIPYDLKYFFASYKDEFKKVEYSEKLEIFRSLVQHGFSTFDLSSIYQKNKSPEYSDEDMKKEIIHYISYLLYNETINPYVNKYFKGLTHKETAQLLDVYLLTDEPYDLFKEQLLEKFNEQF